MDVQIQRVKPEQADSLTRIALEAKAHWGYPERWLELWKPQLTFNSQYFEENESWVAEIDGSPAAFYTLLEDDGNAWIENLWVSPEFMGRGLGKRLFLHAAALSSQRGYQRLQLEADPNAVGFYERMGMRRIGERQSQIEGVLRLLPLMEMSLMG